MSPRGYGPGGEAGENQSYFFTNLTFCSIQ